MWVRSVHVCVFMCVFMCVCVSVCVLVCVCVSLHHTACSWTPSTPPDKPHGQQDPARHPRPPPGWECSCEGERTSPVPARLLLWFILGTWPPGYLIWGARHLLSYRQPARRALTSPADTYHPSGSQSNPRARTTGLRAQRMGIEGGYLSTNLQPVTCRADGTPRSLGLGPTLCSGVSPRWPSRQSCLPLVSVQL